MSDQEHERLGEIFFKALELDSASRERFLVEACAGDVQLRSDVDLLLADEDRALQIFGRFLTDSETEPLPPTLEAPESIGPYRVLEVLGEGGMGIVYLVEQETPLRRRVALKVIKPGMDSKRVLARFESERQALALMNHPNIAQVFDAGATDEGRPYFVMERVSGIPITDHCDRHRLTIEERLELFVKVCHAVQHAHQKGIIHRDLKPSNILVSFGDEGAVPKIIDFGVSKALDRSLTEETVFTQRGEMVGTPAYMSPEQVELTAQDIDTRTDIYSLGVLLYQLLTGMLPFDNVELHLAGFDGMRRMIRDVDPKKPSTRLSTAAKRPDTASTLAHLRRLDDLETLTHRIRDDLDWITMKCLEKDRSRRYSTAEKVAEDVRRYLDNRPVDARPPSVTYRFRKWTRRHQGLLASIAAVGIVLLAGVAAATKLAVDRAYERRQRTNAEATADRYAAEELVFEAGLLMYRNRDAARRMLQEALEKDPDQVDAKVLLVYLAILDGAIREAVHAARDVLGSHPDSGAAAAMLSSLVRGEDPGEADDLERRASLRLSDAELSYYLALGEAQDRNAVELLTRSLELNPWQFDALWQRATRLFRLRNFDEMLADAELLVKVRSDLAQAWAFKGAALAGIGGRLPEVLASFDEALDRDASSWLVHYNRAWAYYKLERYDEALVDLERADELDPGNHGVLRFLGDVFRATQRWDDAIASYDRAIEAGDEGPLTLRKRAEAAYGARRFDEAATFFSRTLEAMPDDDPDRSTVLRFRALSHLNGQRLGPARVDFEALIESNPDLVTAHFNLGRIAMLDGDPDRALTHYQRVVELDAADEWKIGRGIARWCLGDHARAAEDLIPLTALDGYESVNLWLWEMASLAGRKDEAARLLEAAGASDDPVVRDVVPMLRGEQTVAELAGAAKAKGNDKAELHAYYYGGSRALVAGDRARADSLFRQAVDFGLINQLEHELAVCHLESAD